MNLESSVRPWDLTSSTIWQADKTSKLRLHKQWVFVVRHSEEWAAANALDWYTNAWLREASATAVWRWTCPSGMLICMRRLQMSSGKYMSQKNAGQVCSRKHLHNLVTLWSAVMCCKIFRKKTKVRWRPAAVACVSVLIGCQSLNRIVG